MNRRTSRRIGTVAGLLSIALFVGTSAVLAQPPTIQTLVSEVQTLSRAVQAGQQVAAASWTSRGAGVGIGLGVGLVAGAVGAFVYHRSKMS